MPIEQLFDVALQMYFFPPKIQFIQWLLHLKNKTQELFSEMQSGSFQRINENLIRLDVSLGSSWCFYWDLTLLVAISATLPELLLTAFSFQVPGGTMKYRIT